MEWLFAVFRPYLLFLFIRNLEAQPSFIQEPVSQQNVTEGDNVTLSWSYNLNATFQQSQLQLSKTPAGGSIQGIFVKYPGGNPTVNNAIQDRFRVQIISDNETSLAITGIQRSDSGKYRYEITVNFKSDAALSEISVLYQSNIAKFFGGNQTLNETDVLNMICEANGNPKPSTSWTRLSDNAKVYSPLTITGKHDEGEYRCTASNGVGIPDSRTFYISVQNHHPVKTIVTTNLEDNTVVVNTTFSITCSAQANPPAKFQFYKGNEYVYDSDDDAVITTSVKDRVKMVNFTCIPFNFYGNGTSSMVPVTVLYPALIESAPVNQVALEKSNVTLLCNATGNPTPNITWTKDNSSSVLHQGDIYSIVNILRDAAGIFTCTASNGLGEQKKATALVAVHYPPSVTIQKQEVTVVEGNNTSFACDASGKPNPTITWTKQGGSEVLSNNSSLDVVNVSRHDAVDDIIQYQCTASNGVGKPATAFVNVTVHYASVIQSAAVDQVVLEGDNLTLYCNASGNPTPNITWTKDDSSSVLHQGDIYSIGNIFRYAAGIYKCTARNGVGEQQSARAVVDVYYAADIVSAPRNQAIQEYDNVTFFCNATSNPPSQIIWTQEGNSTVLHKGETFVIRNVSKELNGQRYKCTTWNNVTKDVEAYAQLTVHYASGGANLTTYPSNTTVLRASHISLICSADASPEAAFNLSFNGTFVKTSASGIFNVTVMSDGVYTCVPFNNFSIGESASVKVIAVDAPSVSISPKAPAVVDGHSLSLTCVASGKPKPSIKWTKFNSSEVLSNDSLLTVNVSRHDAKNNLIQYQCAASNGVGTPRTRTATVSIEVYYPAVNNASTNATVNRTLGPGEAPPCHGEGYPRPTITLTAHYSNGNKKNLSTEGSKLIWKVESPSLFQCTVENELAIQTVWLIIVFYASNFTVEMTIVNKNCRDEFEEIAQKLKGYVFDVVKTSSAIKKTEYLDTFRCGSVTVYVSLIFGQNVEIENILRVLKKAATEEKFGDLQVDPKSIQAISRERIPKRSTPASTPVDTTTEVHPTEPNCQDSFIPESNCPLSVAFIVFLVVLAVILFSVTFAIIIYCLYKRRKCRKDSRVHGTQSEERPFSPSNENDYSKVNSGYAETGPRSTERANLDHNQEEEGAAAIPDYAVVDKSKRKGKKKDKRAAEMKPTEDQYAIVDKSKKKTKLKNEPDATYAEVDCQKNSKKKPKPGDVLYADLGEFHQMKKMPAVSTSPKALPPIKRPEAYAETQYADITQFLKGNLEDPGAELPKDNTTPAVNNTATGSKEESSARNTGDGAEAANETGF